VISGSKNDGVSVVIDSHRQNERAGEAVGGWPCQPPLVPAVVVQPVFEAGESLVDDLYHIEPEQPPLVHASGEMLGNHISAIFQALAHNREGFVGSHIQ